MSPVKITVKSALPEFSDLRFPVQFSVEPDLTWADLLSLLNIRNFDPDRHGIKSKGRSIAFAEDRIQQTSSLYKVQTFIVKIVSINPVDRPQPRRARDQKFRRSSRRDRSRSSNSTIPMPSTSRAGPSRPFPEDDYGTPNYSGPNMPEMDHLNYAESMLSEDSQTSLTMGVESSRFSQLKERVVRRFQRVPDADLDTMLKELKNLAATDQRYRWQRKAPLISGLILDAFNVLKMFISK